MQVTILDITRRLQAAGLFAPAILRTVENKPSEYKDLPKVYVANNASFENLELKHGETVLSFASTMLTKSGSMGNIFAPPPLLTHEKSKITEITKIDGSDAEVVERYGDSQWDIMIEGVLVDMEAHQFPLQKIKQLREFFEIPDAVDVSSELLNIGFDVFNIHFGKVRMNGVPGFADTYFYSLPARSIKPAEFYLNNEEQ